ncbi:hypothetical protein F5884DRAFT_862936 [Xylogone sp. PMI_703]|nr:hypothetical protein F5884DRAFT_862936 [Xylogone sp. PMI_703]
MATQTITNTTAVSALASIPVYSPFKLEGPYGDWRDELKNNGYVVIKGAITSEKAKYYQQKAFEWVKSLDPSFDADDVSTWNMKTLPVQNDKNMFEHYAVVHERFYWDARMEPGVIEPFARLWGTEKLLASFDALNITFPNLRPARAPWPHVDQAPRKRGLHCIQGILNLSHAGSEDGSLIAIPQSNKHLEAFYEEYTKPSDWEWRDKREFNKKEMEFFYSRCGEPIRVQAEAGDLILWDSRTVHWGGEPTEKSNTVRTVMYIAYTPAALASKESLALKKHIFETYGSTSHWPHDNIHIRDPYPYLPNGIIDPRNRTEPREKPEYTDQLLRLAGVKPY